MLIFSVLESTRTWDDGNFETENAKHFYSLLLPLLLLLLLLLQTARLFVDETELTLSSANKYVRMLSRVENWA
jgi:hypothetical protein